MRYSNRHSAFLLFALLAALSFSCARAPRPVEYRPYESLMQILSDFAPHRADDLYARGYPRDIAGMNLYQATLQRLDNYQTLHPALYPDIIGVTRGQLLERLGDYDGAIKAHGDLGANPSEEMKAGAAQSLDRVKALQAAAQRPLDTSNLPHYLADLQIQREDLEKLAGQFAGTPYEPLARIEAEKADCARVILLFNSRYILPDGLNGALHEARAFLERWKDSHLAQQHALLVGDFYFTAARDYATLNSPERSGFDAAEFDPLVAGARELYFQVSQKDGAPEKPEARAKLQALEAFNQRIQDEKPLAALK